MWGPWEGEACQEVGGLGEDAGDHVRSFFPAKAVLATLVGSLELRSRVEGLGTHTRSPPQ